jgi:hypothetical protein
MKRVPADDPQDAIAAVWYAYEVFRVAKTIGEQAYAWNHLADAVCDLVTWHSQWNPETGELVRSA